jgi:hypothetical protein
MSSAKDKRLRHLQRIYNPAPSVDNAPPISYLLRNCCVPFRDIPLVDTPAARGKRKALYKDFHASSESVFAAARKKSNVVDRRQVMMRSVDDLRARGRDEGRKTGSRVSSAYSFVPRDSGVSSSCSAVPGE